MMRNAQYKMGDGSILNYYEIGTAKDKLLLLHAQGTNSLSFNHVLAKLTKYYHVYLVDYYGHGGSSNNPEKYNLISIGNDMIHFIENVICDSVTVLGHSSGGLIAAYVAAYSDKCTKLILEDPPFFSSWGERRYNTYNYKDLSTACHNFLSQSKEKDFVHYYFVNQYCWNFFPEESRERIREKLGGFALKYREKHPNKNLKVLFWPKKFLEGFNGLQHYDPRFGEAFYNDSFNDGVNYCELLSRIKCKTLFMKAKTTIGENGLLQGALSDEDLQQVKNLIETMEIERFDCGHGIHVERPKQFVQAVVSM